eukprot:1423795-Heterocapsa_arctica.AAC.1
MWMRPLVDQAERQSRLDQRVLPALVRCVDVLKGGSPAHVRFVDLLTGGVGRCEKLFQTS